jgi:hypothetical protein
MRSVRPARTVVVSVISLIALVSLGCSAQGKVPPSSSSEGAAAATGAPASPRVQPSGADETPIRGALLAVGRSGQPDLEIIETDKANPAMTLPIGTPDSTWSHFLSTSQDGGGTIVQNRVFGEDGGPKLRLDGRWQLPVVGLDPLPAGRSLNDSTVVLVQDQDAGAPAGTTRFAVIRSAPDGSLELIRTIDLRGAFDYDALSPTGSILYVVELLGGGHGEYQVRSLPTTSGPLDTAVIADKRNLGEAMAGKPVTQIRRADGTVLTLYLGAEHPFVHALNSVDRWAVCIDLPANGADDADAAQDWGLTERADGKAIYATNATLGLVVDINPDQLAVRRSARIPATTAAGPSVVLAKFAPQESGTAGRRTVVTPDGATIVAGGRSGLVGIATKDLSVAWRALPGESVRGVAVTRDGSTVFALLGSGRIAAVRTTAGSVLGTLPGSGYDRMVAVTGGV